MAGALELLEAAHEARAAHEHLLRDCPWYQHVDKGGHDHPDLHCRDAAAEGGALVKFTPRTPEASTVPQPTVPPGGPGLFHIKGRELPPYIQHVYKHLVSRYGKHEAYGVAVGIVKKWAAGVNPGGKHPTKTHADVRAAAQKNVAEWEKDKADAHAAASAVELAGPQMMTAPGTRPTFVPPTPGGQYQQYGMYQNPVQSVAPSPPLPPSVPLPTPAEVLAVIPLVPECSQADLSATARKFLEQAAYKLKKGSPLEALAVMRSAQAALYAAHKADQGNMLPSAYMANVFTRIPPAGQSSATAAMKQGTDQTMRWRKAEQALGALSDRIRKRYFHGVYNGPSQMARFTEDGMTALDKVLALAAITTGKDVSEPVESDTTGATPLLQAPEGLLDIADEDARKELAGLPLLDRLRVDAYLAAARRMVSANPFGASQMALRACGVARAAGAHCLARHIHGHVRALAEAGNLTNPADTAARMEAGGKTVSPHNSPQTVADTGNNATSLSAVEKLRLAAGAGTTAGSSAGSSFGSPGAAERLGSRIGIQVVQAPATRTSSRPSSSSGAGKGGPVIHSATPPPGEPGPVSYAHHLHELHMQHVQHVQAVHAAHAAQMNHLVHQRFGGAG